MLSSIPFISTINNFISSTSTDVATLTSVITKGLPTDSTQINLVVLAALRVLSAAIIATATILGFSAVNITDLTQITASFPMLIAPALTAIIVFHDLYVGSSNVSSSLTAAGATSTSTSLFSVAPQPSLVSSLLGTHSHTSKPTTHSSTAKPHSSSATTHHVTTKLHPSKIIFKSGKTLSQVEKEGSSSLSTELTTGMWLFKWPLNKLNSHWTPSVAKRFYNTTLKT